MPRRLIRSSAGITIIEALVSGGIIAILMGLLFVVLNSVNLISRTVSAATGIYNAELQATQEMSRWLRSGLLMDIDVEPTTDPEQHIAFRLPLARDSGGYVAWIAVQYDSTDYRFACEPVGVSSIQQLVFRRTGMTDRVLAYNVTTCTFRLLDAAGATVTLPIAGDNNRSNAAVESQLEKIRFVEVKVRTGVDARYRDPNWTGLARTISSRIMLYNTQDHAP